MMVNNWIENVPNEWKLLRLGSLFNVRNQKVSDKDYRPLSVSKGGIVPQMDSVAKSDASDDRKLVLKGDFAINSRSDRKQSCGVAPMDGSVSLINTILYAKDNNFIYTPYLNYLLKNYGFAEEFYKWGHGIVADLWTTRWQEMKSILLPVPDYQEQIGLTNILDKKINQIDELISNQEKQIEKLEEYKQSIITNAVTKGLDPYAKMKDSGVEWIGEIPEGWNVLKLKYCYFNRDKKYECGNYPYIALENIESKSGKYIFTETNANYSLDGTVIAYKNDTIFGKLRPYLAKAFTLTEDSCVSTEFAVFYSTNCSTTFLKYLFLSSKFIDVINSSTYGTKMPRANIEFINDLYISIPSIGEQNEITNYLEGKCKNVDYLISIKNIKINKLKDYKKSLIYECVTGKKKVA